MSILQWPIIFTRSNLPKNFDNLVCRIAFSVACGHGLYVFGAEWSNSMDIRSSLCSDLSVSEFI